MNLDIIGNNGIGRVPGHTMHFTLSIILFSTVHLVWSLELPVQETLENPNIKINSIHEYEGPPICTSKRYVPTGLNSYVYPEEGWVIDHPNKLLEQISTSVFQPSKYNPGTSGRNHASINESTSNDDIRSIQWVNEPQKEGSINLPLKGHRMTWSQMWDASSPHSKLIQRIPWEPSDCPILPSSTFVEYNPQVPEYDYTSHNPGPVLHQNTEGFENKLEVSHISGDEVNDIIMESFPNHNHLVSSDFLGTFSCEYTPRVPDDVRHSLIPTLHQNRKFVYESEACHIGTREANDILFHNDHNLISDIMYDVPSSSNQKPPQITYSSHIHAPISSMNGILQDRDLNFGIPQYASSLSAPPEGCHQHIVASQSLGIPGNELDRAWSTSSITNKTPSTFPYMPSHQDPLPHIESFNMHCFPTYNEPLPDTRSPNYLINTTGAPGFFEQHRHQFYAPPLSQSQIAQKGDSESEIPQYQNILGEPYANIDDQPNEPHISKENYNSRGMEQSYCLVPKITPRDSEHLLSSELELLAYMSQHTSSHFPNYDHLYSANRFLNDGPNNLNTISTPMEDRGISQYTDGQQESSALLHHLFDRSQGFDNQKNERVTEGLESLVPNMNYLDSVCTSLSKHSPLNMENDSMPQDPLHHKVVEDELNYPHKENDMGEDQPGESNHSMTTSHISRESDMSNLNLIKLQGESSVKLVQRSNPLKRKASKNFAMRSDVNIQTLSMKDTQNNSADTSYDSRLMNFINMHNDGLSIPKGTKSKDMVCLIQDVGMKSIESEGLWSQYHSWYDNWREQMVRSIRASDDLGLLNDVNQKYLLNAVGMVNKGMVMGFLGLLSLIESQIAVHSVGSNIINEGLGFIQNFLGDMPSLVLKKLPHFIKIKTSNIDIASNPLDLFLSLTHIQRRRDIKVQLYHNIWSNWKSQKAPSTPYISISSFHKVLYRITLADSTQTKMSVRNVKKNQGKVQALTDAELYRIRFGIVNKGRKSMNFFKSIFLNRRTFFQCLETELLTKLNIEKNKMTHEYYIDCNALLLNAIKVVDKTVVEGFFGVVQCLHEESNLKWNLKPLQENGWSFLQNHFSSWKSIPLENLFLEKGLSRAEKHHNLNPELEFAVKSFHIVMHASSTNPMSQKLVQSLLRNWIWSLDTDQKHFKSFQDLFISKDKTPFIHWFKF